MSRKGFPRPLFSPRKFCSEDSTWLRTLGFECGLSDRKGLAFQKLGLQGEMVLQAGRPETPDPSHEGSCITFVWGTVDEMKVLFIQAEITITVLGEGMRKKG